MLFAEVFAETVGRGLAVTPIVLEFKILFPVGLGHSPVICAK
jgi:hypothetical protein